MMAAYDETYVPDAMESLACFFDYGVNDYGAEGSELADLFAMSKVARAFERGESRVVAGMGGFELFCALSRELGYADDGFVSPQVRYGKTREYWVGWTAAYAQWRLGLSFDDLFALVPYDDFAVLYGPFHEASEEMFCDEVARRLTSWNRRTRLQAFRMAAGLTQRELASKSGVSLRSVQMYEQRNKDINRAQAGSLLRIARCLACTIEDLLEPEIEDVR